MAPGDLTGQIVQVFRNVAKSLDAAGASFQDVVRFTWYVVDWQKESFDAFQAGLAQAPPATLIGVTGLFDESLLMEAEVTAVID